MVGTSRSTPQSTARDMHRSDGGHLGRPLRRIGRPRRSVEVSEIRSEGTFCKTG
jgi:hypothetical protein